MFLIYVSLFACENKDISPTFTHEIYVKANENPWGDATGTDEQITEDVKTYLDGKNIKVKEIGTGLILVQHLCVSGECLTGLVVKIRVSEKNSKKLAELDEGWRRI